MKQAKKVFRFLSSILFYSVVLILGIAILMFLSSFIDKKISMKNGEYRSPLFGAYIIISESMVPHINVYDAVVTVRVDAESIQVDDIITFISKEIETAGTPITHRVIGIVYEDETKQKIMGFRTKGDHNNTADFALIAPDEVIGKVFLRIPMIGYLQTIMTKPIGWLLIVVLPCLLIIGSDIIKLIKTSKNKEESPPSEESDNISRITSNDLLTPAETNDVQLSTSDSASISDITSSNSVETMNQSDLDSNHLMQQPQQSQTQNIQNFEADNDLNSIVTTNLETPYEVSNDSSDQSDRNNII